MSVPKNAYLLALARRRTYLLFGRLFLEGLNSDLLPQLEAVPQLAELAELNDPDDVAASHYQLISVSVFPYQAIFLDPSGLLGGPVSARIAVLYAQNGYHTAGQADHIGQELLFLSHLCALEAAAHIEGAADTAVLWGGRQQAFLSAQLLRWLPPLVVTIEQAGDEFYGRLARLTLELAADHLQLQGAAGSPSFLPPAPLLAADESGLKEIAAALLTPPLSGIFLSRDAVSELARHQNLPRGFGDRTQMLTNLLRSAGRYERAPAVFGDIAALFLTWEAAYAGQIERHAHLSPWVQPWQERCAQTARQLQALSAAAELS